MIDAPAVIGHWRRDWLRAPGRTDDTNRVHWMQAAAGYADLRIPVDQPRISPDVPLSALDDGTLLSLMQAEGFAGTISVADGICTWDRAINWHGAPDGADVGALRWDDQARLIETGVHADYAEQWVRLPDRPIAAIVLACDDWRLHAAWSDDAFVIGIGRPDATPTGPLCAALARGERPPALADHFRGLFALGTWDAGRGIAGLCTHPGLAGTALIDRSALENGKLTIRRPGFNGDTLTEDWVT